MVFAEIITIGDELLIGQVIDTNSAWIGQKLNENGISVKQITSVRDNQEHIINALDEASHRADLILITGGLGPTKDDITKKTLSLYFNSRVRLDEPSLKIIEAIFEARGRAMTDINRRQAEVPDNCIVILNHHGTAPAMMFERNNKIFISMPGVPSEMKGIMTDSVLPMLRKKYSMAPIIHRTILTQGIGESFLSEMISEWEDSLPSNMKLAYLPTAGMVRLRITAIGDDESQLTKEIENKKNQLSGLIDQYIFGYEDDTLEGIVGLLLHNKKMTVCTAESCTGGYIAHKITSVPGASEYFTGSIIAYDNEVKLNELQVDMSIIEKYGAVSEEVVTAMIKGAFRKFDTDYCIAASGIAGPSGGTNLKPVGTVWVAIASRNEIVTARLQLGRMRERVIIETAQHALNMLRKLILKASA